MKIKVGDEVIVITGKDKGKTGTVTKTLKKENKVIVSGINIAKKHQKPTSNNDKGGIIEIECPIHVSNVKKTETKKEDKKKTTKTSGKKKEE